MAKGFAFCYTDSVPSKCSTSTELNIPINRYTVEQLTEFQMIMTRMNAGLCTTMCPLSSNVPEHLCVLKRILITSNRDPVCIVPVMILTLEYCS